MGSLAGCLPRAVFGAALTARPLSRAGLVVPWHGKGHQLSTRHRHSAPSGRENCLAAQMQPGDRRRGWLAGCARERRRRSPNIGGDGPASTQAPEADDATTQTAYEEVAEVALQTPAAPEPAVVVVRRKRWQSFLIALASLVFIGVVALCVMLAGGAVLHAFTVHKHVDLFAAFHNQWVVDVLLGIAVLWVLPPIRGGSGPSHRCPKSNRHGQPEGTEDGGAIVTVQLDGPGPKPSPGQLRTGQSRRFRVTHDQYH